MSQSDTTLYEFGAFRLDVAERVLWRGEELLVLPPKVFDTLRMLIEKEGRVVSKSELMEAIWADAFVEESNLSQNIYMLRRTLGVNEQGRQFIETVPRRGYRFAVPVKLLKVSNGGAEQAAEVGLNNAGINSNRESLENSSSPPSSQHSTNDSPVSTTEQPETFSPSAPVIRSPYAVHYGLIAGLGLMIVFALGLYQFVIRPGDKPRLAPIEQVRLQKLTDSGDVAFPTISPNGELLAYVRQEEQVETVWVKQIATGSSVQTLPPSREGYRSLAFSADARYLFFREKGDPAAIYQTPAFGGAPKKVAIDVWSDFSISPDNRRFAFIRRDIKRNTHMLILSNIDGSGENELSSREFSLNDGGLAPAWSPDGTKLVVTANSPQKSLPVLMTVDAVTGQETELKTQSWRVINCILWSPNGKQLVISARTPDALYSQVWMLDYPDGEARRLTNDLDGYFWLSRSADGRMLVTRQQRTISRLWMVKDGDLKQARQLTVGERSLDGFVGLAWTPDDKIVFSSFAGNITNLYSLEADGTNRVQLTNTGQENTYPTVSQDGRFIVFTSDRTGNTQIWRMDIDGRNQKQLTFAGAQNQRGQSAALAHDDAEVFFIKRGAGPAAIWKVSLEGGAAVQISPLTDAAPEGFLAISPDGKWLAYRRVSAQPAARGENRSLRIGVLPIDGNADPKLFDLEVSRPMIQWAADSAAFYFVGGLFNSSSLCRQPLAGGEPQKLLDFPDRIFNFAWSRDGTNLVVSRGRRQGDAILITNLPE